MEKHKTLWRGDLSPLGCAAALRPATSAYQADCIKPILGLLRSPTGINPLATMNHPIHIKIKGY
jgi:hypothetical protein